LTTTLDPEVVWDEVAWVAGAELALVVLELLLELLPHAASGTVAASAAMSRLIDLRMMGLLFGRSVSLVIGSSSALTQIDHPQPFSFRAHHDPPRTANDRVAVRGVWKTLARFVGADGVDAIGAIAPG
jgi:hypothetical protein